MMSQDKVRICQALISVSDKTGIVEFARFLHEKYQVKLISTGGTAQLLRDAGLAVRDAAEVTGYPECLDGRVKTMHPALMGGILYQRNNLVHQDTVRSMQMASIDLVVVNLYPFEQTIQKPGVTLEEAIENIDIGGPTMLRSAAKNHESVVVASNIGHYKLIRDEMIEHDGATTAEFRLCLAADTFAATHEYDGRIANYLELSRLDRDRY